MRNLRKKVIHLYSSTRPVPQQQVLVNEDVICYQHGEGYTSLLRHLDTLRFPQTIQFGLPKGPIVSLIIEVGWALAAKLPHGWASPRTTGVSVEGIGAECTLISVCMFLAGLLSSEDQPAAQTTQNNAGELPLLLPGSSLESASPMTRLMLLASSFLQKGPSCTTHIFLLGYQSLIIP